jgi:hypothetical protein
MVVTLGHISHICGNWKHKPKPHGAGRGAKRSREILGNRPASLIVLLSSVMLSKVTVSVAVGLALFAATVRLPATPCFVTNTPSEKACQPGCCANKTCCATSHERTGPPVQPFAKSGLDQQNLTTPPTAVVAVVLNQTATESLVFSSVEWAAHSLPPLELICICLI